METARLSSMRKYKLIVTNYAEGHPALVAIVGFSLLGLVISVSGLIFDDRLISGEHAWIKPCKFSISLCVYGLTLLYYSRFLANHQLLLRRISVAALVGTVIELSAIITQVIRGTTSHFNTSTAFNHAMFMIAVAAIIPVAGSTVILFTMVLREKKLPGVLRASLISALLLTIIGFVPGVLMVLPDRLQDAITCYKQFEGHTVGMPEGGPGIPWLGWSTVAGDLRIAHFVGIHALQVLPLVGLLISMIFRELSSIRQQILVWIFALCYLAAIVLLSAEALSGESLFAPSVQMKVLVAAVVLSGTIASACTLWLPAVSIWKTRPARNQSP